MKSFSIIVAIAQNHAIGKNNDLLWHISEDLKHFKRITLDHTVIMGLKTFESLPVRPFPKRRNIVIVDDPSISIEGCAMAYSIEEAIALCDDDKENFICGGGSIYRQFMPLADKLYLTMVYRDFEADIFFPEIDYSQWDLKDESELQHDEKSGLAYRFLLYERKK